jgi:hypothetical protein
MPPSRVVVCLEVTPKQAVASALDWPGWCRAGRDEDAALKALPSYARRYAPVAGPAGTSFPAAAEENRGSRASTMNPWSAAGHAHNPAGLASRSRAEHSMPARRAANGRT